MPNGIMVKLESMENDHPRVVIYQKVPYKHKVVVSNERLAWVMLALSYAINFPYKGQGKPYDHYQIYGPTKDLGQATNRMGRLSLCMYQHTPDINLMGYNATITMTPMQAKRVLKRLLVICAETSPTENTDER